MRYRSRSRDFESSDCYKGHRTPDKYESSRRHKSKETRYSSDTRKTDNSKYNRITEKSRYDAHQNSESDDKATRRRGSSYDKDFKKLKHSKYDEDESTHEKRSRRLGDYTHSYRRNSISSDISNDSYKYKHGEDKYDYKKSYYKESKRSKVTKSLSSDHQIEAKVKVEPKERKDKKVKKKCKKNEKEKIDKKKKKKQKQSSDDGKILDGEKHIKYDIKKMIKTEPTEDTIIFQKGEVKLEPFKMKEVVKKQVNVLNSSNIFTKDEWQKEVSDEEKLKRKDSSKGKCLNKTMILKNNEPSAEKCLSNETVIIKKTESSKTKHSLKDTSNEIPSIEISKVKEEKSVKKVRSHDDEDANRRKRRKNSKEKNIEKVSKHSKEKDNDAEKYVSTKSKSSRSEQSSHSHSKTSADKPKSSDYKDKKSRDYKYLRENKNNEDRKRSEEYLSEDERLELPRTPTDAHFAGLLTRLKEESVSDTDIEDIIPPMLLDNRMNALLDNDPNAAQEAWDSEDDLLLNKKESLIAPKHRGVLETLSVPWKLLIEESSLTNKPVVRSENMCKYEIPNMLANIGISYKLAGEKLCKQICVKYSNVFLNPIPLIHQSLLSQNIRRSTIFRERCKFTGALSARKDFFIRKMLIEPII